MPGQCRLRTINNVSARVVEIEPNPGFADVDRRIALSGNRAGFRIIEKHDPQGHRVASRQPGCLELRGQPIGRSDDTWPASATTTAGETISPATVSKVSVLRIVFIVTLLEYDKQNHDRTRPVTE